MSKTYAGLMFIGDPHLASRIPGFRKDDYPKVVLEKLDWCLETAKKEQLLPILLGDIFHYPRDNANWLLVEFMRLLEPFKGEVLSVTGNHDCFENNLSEHDSLLLFSQAKQLRLLDQSDVWQGMIADKQVQIGGSAWNQAIPTEFVRVPEVDSVFWLTHHNLAFNPEWQGMLSARPIPGIDFVINGHIHTPQQPLQRGDTQWLNPGNIARVSRGDTHSQRAPQMLVMHPMVEGWHSENRVVPHEAYEAVFHASIEQAYTATAQPSAFITGLAELQSRQTHSGAVLHEFLKENLKNVDPQIAQYIFQLAQEFIEHDAAE